MLHVPEAYSIILVSPAGQILPLPEERTSFLRPRTPYRSIFRLTTVRRTFAIARWASRAWRIWMARRSWKRLGVCHDGHDDIGRYFCLLR